MRFEFASTTRVDEFCKEVTELLHHFASILKEPEDTEDEWLSYTFVSDESRLADFFHQDFELTQFEKLAGISDLKMRDLIADLAFSVCKHRQAGGPGILLEMIRTSHLARHHGVGLEDNGIFPRTGPPQAAIYQGRVVHLYHPAP